MKLASILSPFVIIGILSFNSSSFSQKNAFIGSWVGQLDGSGMDMKIAFHITEHDGIFITKMDSPEQNSFGNPAQSTTIKDNKISIDLPLMGAKYDGVKENDSIKGTFYQSGLEIKLNLGVLTEVLTGPKRPQTPTAPFDYKTKDVKIKTSNEKVKLAGTLTIPNGKGPFPAVILVSGSGPQDRNEELLLHKPFLVLADYLTKNGIAVLRYDDRGVGLSTGDFESGTTYDFAEDAEAAFTFLSKQKGVNPKKVGIIGHSEGGIIAPMVASKNEKVAFIALMAGPSVPGSVIIPDQQELIFKVNKMEESELTTQMRFNKMIIDYVVNNSSSKTLMQDLTSEIEKWVKENKYSVPKSTSPKNFAKQTAFAFAKPWMKEFILLQPAQYLEQVNCPVLALFGENDLQVSVRANVVPMQQLLSSKNESTVHIFPHLNHLFQTSKTGSPAEYNKIEETLSEDFLRYITEWINKR